jgi:adenosyl cobinamide kinase/adenosyl cobinamide phosphate guanylyltransferase
VSLVLLLGGARAGKSAAAQRLAERWDGPVTFVATAEALDEEMAARIARHRRERPAGWTTVEEPLALREAVAAVDSGSAAIVDCLTLWVANTLGRGEEAVLAEAAETAALAAAHGAPVIVVSNEVGLGIVPANAEARAYRDRLGAVNRVFAERAETAALVVAGRLLRLEETP